MTPNFISQSISPTNDPGRGQQEAAEAEVGAGGGVATSSPQQATPVPGQMDAGSGPGEPPPSAGGSGGAGVRVGWEPGPASPCQRGTLSPKILSEHSGDALQVMSFPRGAPCPGRAGRAATQGDDEEPIAAHHHDLLFRFGF